MESNGDCIKDMLKGMRVGVYGWEEMIMGKVEDLVSTIGGSAVSIRNQNRSRNIELLWGEANLDVLVIPKEKVNWISIVEDGELKEPEFPCVGIEWLNACVAGGYRHPTYYAYNYLYIKPKGREREITQLLSQKEKRVNLPLLEEEDEFPVHQKVENSKDKEQPKQRDVK
jgi:hypothetical protein